MEPQPVRLATVGRQLILLIVSIALPGSASPGSAQDIVSATPALEVPTEVTSLVGQLRDGSFPTRRSAYKELKTLLEPHRNDSQWKEWIREQIEKEEDPEARSHLLGVEQQSFEYNRSILDEDGLLGEIAAIGQPTKESVFESNVIDSRGIILDTLRGELFGYITSILPMDQPLVRKTELEAAFQKIQETSYKELKSSYMINLFPYSDDFKRPNEEEVTVFAQGYTSCSEFLRDSVRHESAFGYGVIPLLFSMGEKENLDLLVANLPHSFERLFFDLAPLYTLLYRKGTLDLLECIGLDQSPNSSSSPFSTAEDIHKEVAEWWGRNRDDFHFEDSHRKGMKQIYFSHYMFDDFGNAFLVPEQNRVFWLDTYQDLEYFSFKALCFDFGRSETIQILNGYHFSHRSSRYECPLLGLEEDLPIWSIEDFRWNADRKRLELDSGDTLICVEMGPEGPVSVTEEPLENPPSEPTFSTVDRYQVIDYQEFENITYELRGGDLFKVNEAEGTEECLVDFGYVLSFYLSRDRTQAVIVDRDPVGPALWSVDLE